MVPGTQRKTKAKRSCLGVRRIMKPGEYHKVKLRTASGGSLTIRYRKRPSLTPDCSSGESSSGEAEASSHVFADQSFTEDGLDENLAFEDLAELPEYSQSCVSGVPSNDCNAFYGCDVQPDFSSYHFWSSDECNSSDIGSNEVLPEIGADSINIPVGMNERFFQEPEYSCPAFEKTEDYSLEKTQDYSLEQSAMLIQQLISSSEGIEVASTLFCMQGCEQLAASLWSLNRGERSFEQGQPLENSNIDFLGFPSLLDQTECSEIELIDLPPLPRYETVGTICLQESTVQRYEHAYENVTAGCMEFNSSKEDGELFDENNFLLIDEGNLLNSVMPQSTPWGAVFEDALQEVAEQAVEEPSAVKEDEEGILQVKDTFDKPRIRHSKASCEDIPRMQDGVLVPAHDSRGQLDSSIPSGSVVTRGKKLRKKRLRRATPLHTLRSLLSSRDEFPSNLDYKVNTICNKANVYFSRKKARRKGINNLMALPAAVHEQGYPDEDTLCSEVTKRSSDSGGASRTFIDSSQLDSAAALSERCNVAHPEKVTSWRFHDPHQAYRSVHEMHGSVSNTSELQKKPCCTSSDDNIVNQDLEIASSQRSIDSGKRAEIRRRPDGRRPRSSCLLPERAVNTLRKWFDDHIAFPFADKEEKLGLVFQTGLTLTQVENWLSNYRHRLKVKRSDYEGTVLRLEKSLTRH